MGVMVLKCKKMLGKSDSWVKFRALFVWDLTKMDDATKYKNSYYYSKLKYNHYLITIIISPSHYKISFS